MAGLEDLRRLALALPGAHEAVYRSPVDHRAAKG
jgi:hypothetical protein